MPEIVFLRANIADKTDNGMCWQITEGKARCISNPALSDPVIDISGYSDLLFALAAQPDSSRVKIFNPADYHLIKTDLELGKFYPRILRRILGDSLDVSETKFLQLHDKELSFGSYIQAQILHSKLQEICKYVHPKLQNMQAYGYEIRNQLILACTEVEAQFVGILKANGIVKERYTTNDYVSLLKVLRLDEYSLNVFSYPWLGSFSPFKDWKSDAPTQSLAWYAAYNAVKHDREGKFDQASFEHAFMATLAVNVLIAAQFGRYNVGSPDYRFDKTPLWESFEIYLPPPYGIDWEVQKLKI